MMRRGVLLGIACMHLVACGRPDLIVVDPDGSPIAGAKVIGISLSTSGPIATTDQQGHAKIPKAAPRTEWIGAQKPGYVPVDNLSVSEVDLPLTIVLKPIDE